MILFLFLGGLLAFSSGSKILFEANPDMIQANLTQTLSMRCSLNDTADAFVGGVVGKRDVTQTASNMQVVTSLVITRNNGEHVATIFGTQPAKALADLSNLHVDGDISGGVGERGYIELTWQYPSTDQVGEYVCEINAVDNQGHNVVFSTSAEIGERQPTIGELVDHVRLLEQQKAEANNQIDQITEELVNMTLEVSNCAGQDHVETGYVTCQDSDNWSRDAQGDWSEYKKHNFTTPYSAPPTVQIGMTSLDHIKTANTRYAFVLSSVDEHGFTVKCMTWGNSKLYRLIVSWISVPV